MTEIRVVCPSCGFVHPDADPLKTDEQNAEYEARFERDTDRAEEAEAVVRASHFCEAHEPNPDEPETVCPMCEAVHQAELCQAELTKCETAYHEQADRADAERAAREKAEQESLLRSCRIYALEQAIRNEGFRECDIAACDCGGLHVDRDGTTTLVQVWRGRAKKAEAENERLRAELLGLIMTGGEVVMENDRLGTPLTTLRAFSTALAEAGEVLAEAAKEAKR